MDKNLRAMRSILGWYLVRPAHFGGNSLNERCVILKGRDFPVSFFVICFAKNQLCFIIPVLILIKIIILLF